MHRLLSYDDTIRKNAMYDLEVYVEDDDARCGLVAFLDGLGYDVTPCCVFVGGNKMKVSILNKLKDAFVSIPHIDYEKLSMNHVITIEHGTVFCGCAVLSGKDYKERTIEAMRETCKPHDIELNNGDKIHIERVCCDDNIDLFKYLACYRKDTDYGKVIYYEDVHDMWWQTTNSNGEPHSENDRISINTQWDDFTKCDVEWVKERCKLCTLEDLKKLI